MMYFTARWMPVVAARRPLWLLSLACLLPLLTASPAQAQDARVENGSLATSDGRLDTGQFRDEYELTATAGQQFVIDLTSDDFDTLLTVRSASDASFLLTNDDHDGNTDRSQITMTAPAAGTYRIIVTSYGNGETGAYRLTINTVNGQGGGGAGGGGPGTRTETGRLEAGDNTLDSGEFRDMFEMTFQAGVQYVLDLRSQDFDTYLYIRSPRNSDFAEVNDDFEGSTQRSRIEFTPPESGVFTVHVTSFAAGETGAYTLTVTGPGMGGGGGGGAAPGGPRVERGRLEQGDGQLESGEYRDVFQFTGQAGAEYVVDLQSTEFDTYIFVRNPRDPEFQPDNDDFEGSTNRSQLTITAGDTGVYEVYVTSFASGETGSYTLSISGPGISGGGGGGAANGAASGVRTESGRLEASDSQLPGGKLYDAYEITAQAGVSYVVNLTSTDFDTYLAISSPRDKAFGEENDDFDGQTTRSQVTFTAPDSGPFQIHVTTYGPGETGAYTLTIEGPGLAGGGNGAASAAGGPRTEAGRLEASDPQLPDGKHHDVFEFTGQSGQAYVINLRSNDFDTLLRVRSPRDKNFLEENDDFEGQTTWSQITMTAPDSGVFEVVVTSYDPGDTGAYTLTIEGPGITGNSSPGGGDGASNARTETGNLAGGDEQWRGGQYRDQFEFTAQAGGEYVIDLRSDDFDTMLVIGNPRNPEFSMENDDFDGRTSQSQVTLQASESGVFQVFVTSFSSGETGAYTLTITGPGAGGGGGPAPPTAGGAGTRNESGRLEAGDSQLEGGEFRDLYEFTAQAGGQYVIDLQSTEFDTYVFVRSPRDSEFKMDNDDFEGQTTRSQITMQAPDAGVFYVHATSFASGETGAYTLSITGPGITAAANTGEFVPSMVREESGELRSGDQTLGAGEFIDLYKFEGAPGQRVRIELTSQDFDTYLILRDPLSNSVDNDDFQGSTHRSLIERDLTEVGTYEIGVTSYEAKETGTYQLVIAIGESSSSPAAVDVVNLETSGRHEGQLTATDAQDESQRYTDRFAFTATAGQRILIDMQSTDFDTLLVLQYPDGTRVDFDDTEDSQNSRIDVKLAVAGRYRLLATSFQPAATGIYSLTVDLSGTGTAPPDLPVLAGRRILGVFVGISDYPGTRNDLRYCDEDAVSLHAILTEHFQMRPEDCVLLTNRQATRAAIESAVNSIGARARPEDLLIFFYSGHGDQRERPGDDVFDPDGVHETLAVYDGQILDDDFARWINSSAAGTCLVALDSCFSGGFAKDVVSARGRMGVFSSQENVLSLVPDKFQAGGYLSRFFAEAIGDARNAADLDHDYALTALEFSHYLGERYRDDVRSTKTGGAAETGGGPLAYVDPGLNVSFQRLVVDWGGLRPEQVLFRWTANE